MDPEFIYHDTIRQDDRNRSRAKSLLQNIASSGEDGSNSGGKGSDHDVSIAPKLAPRVPAQAEVPRRRAKSVTLNDRSSKHNYKDKSIYLVAPLTAKEIEYMDEMRKEVMLKFDGELDDDFDEEVCVLSDEIEWSNMYNYTYFQEMTNIYSRSCSELLGRTKDISAYLDKLTEGLEHVRLETTNFQQTCDSLISEYDHTSELLKNVDENLAIFTKLEKATRILHAPGSDLVTKKQSFKQLLQDLDQGLEYVESHAKFKDIDLYQMRYRQCMTRALTLCQSYFNTQIRNLTSHIQQQISAKLLNSTTQQALLYSRFENESEQLKPLTDEIAVRCEAGHQEYYGLLSECMKGYFASRQRLLTPVIPKNLEDSYTGTTQDLIQFTRYGLSFYKQLCYDERNLFDKFFSRGHSEVDDWLMGLCEPLYDALRQRIIRETDITNLCEITSILIAYEPEYGEQLDENLVNYAALFQPILQDVQSRLVFRVQSIVDAEIVKHVPQPEDLSVLGHRKEKEKDKGGDHSTTTDFDTEELFKGWYPPMKRAIMLLSQIYQLVNSAVFDDLAHGILHECLVSLSNAQSLAVARLGELEGQLFLIKHLLILSQQIAGFDIDTIPAETSIDFSGLQEAFTRVRSEGVSFAGQNLLNLAKESVPKVVNNMLDAKEELYAKLKNAIHDFTESAVKSIVKPIIDNPDGSSAVEATRQLRQDATVELPRIRKVISGFIDDGRTIDILIDSIQDLVVQTYERYQQQVESTASPEQLDGLMDSDGLVAFLGDVVGKLG